MDTTGSDGIPACGASTNVLVREGRAIYPKVIKADGHHPEIGIYSHFRFIITCYFYYLFCCCF